MTTRKAQLGRALAYKDETPADLLAIFVKNQHGDYDFDHQDAPIEQLEWNQVPEREFDAGYGGTEGEPYIAFTANYVYICVQYDGSEHMTGIPRNPVNIKEIPWVGG